MDQLLAPDTEERIRSGLRLKPFPYFVVDDFLRPELFHQIDADFQRLKDSLAYADPDDEYATRAGEPRGKILRIGMGNNGRSEECFAELRSRSGAWNRLFTTLYSQDFFYYLLSIFRDTEPYRERVGWKRVRCRRGLYRRSVIDKFLFFDCCIVCKLARYTNNIGFLPHQDHGEKVVALLFYLGDHGWLPDSRGGTQIWSNEDTPHLAGWSEYPLTPEERGQLKLHEDVAFKPNRLLGFLKTPNSWHGAFPMVLPPGVYRDCLQINICVCSGRGLSFKMALATKRLTVKSLQRLRGKENK